MQRMHLYVLYFGGLAQLGEHLPYKQRVGGSIPSSSTIFRSGFRHNRAGNCIRYRIMPV
ncbi:hypothetical protein EMIT074MI3_40199 [Bacillus licheniformis]